MGDSIVGCGFLVYQRYHSFVSPQPRRCSRPCPRFMLHFLPRIVGAPAGRTDNANHRCDRSGRAQLWVHMPSVAGRLAEYDEYITVDTRAAGDGNRRGGCLLPSMSATQVGSTFSWAACTASMISLPCIAWATSTRMTRQFSHATGARAMSSPQWRRRLPTTSRLSSPARSSTVCRPMLRCGWDQVLVIDNMRAIFPRYLFLTKTIGLSVFCEGPVRIGELDDNRARLGFFVSPVEEGWLRNPVVSSMVLRGALPVVREFYRRCSSSWSACTGAAQAPEGGPRPGQQAVPRRPGASAFR